MSASVDELLAKIKGLSETIWDHRADEQHVNNWLKNFLSPANGTEDERKLHALYLLSQFIYFGSRQMREMMQVLFRDLYRRPIIEAIRKDNADTTDRQLIEREFQAALEGTLFLGVGNPSESGCHLLYYFRQENALPKTCFIDTHQIFRRQRLTKSHVFRIILSLFRGQNDPYAGTLALGYPKVHRYVFIDDFCGSGHQGVAYSRNVVEDIKSLNPFAHISYFVLFGTQDGISVVRRDTEFDVVECVFELDSTFCCFSPSSRYFPSPYPNVTAEFAKEMCSIYGTRLFPQWPLGYGDCQLLLGFQHNTPDNTLPIFWSDRSGSDPWRSIFRRYLKQYE